MSKNRRSAKRFGLTALLAFSLTLHLQAPPTDAGPKNGESDQRRSVSTTDGSGSKAIRRECGPQPSGLAASVPSGDARFQKLELLAPLPLPDRDWAKRARDYGNADGRNHDTGDASKGKKDGDGKGGGDDDDGDDPDGGGDGGTGGGSGEDLANQPHAYAEIMAEFRSTSNPAIVALRHNLRILDVLPGTNIYRLGIVTNLTVPQMAAELSADTEVLRVEANFLTGSPEIQQRSAAFIDQRSAAFIDGTSPTNYYDQGALLRIRAAEAQSIAQGDGVIVAIIDTGVEPTHPALVGHLASSSMMRDFVDGDNQPWEAPGGAGAGHGTFVAGLIALIAPGARILPLRVFDQHGEGNVFNISKAIIHAVQVGASVINMSFGLPGRSFVVDAAIDFAHAPRDPLHPEYHPAVLVASAGNANTESPRQFPAANSYVFGVSSTSWRDQKSEFSNFGSHISVTAPGEGIYSSFIGGRWATWNGTSFSAALVSGQAALVLSHLSMAYAFACAGDALEKSADQIDALNPDFVGKLGYGRINLWESVQFICGQK